MSFRSLHKRETRLGECKSPDPGRRLLSRLWGCVVLLVLLVAAGFFASEAGLQTDLEARNLSPGFLHPFGTDWLGRDMLTRVLLGLRLSFLVGLTAAATSTLVGIILGVLSATFGGMVDRLVVWSIDFVMSLPHLVFQILIAFAFGGGTKGVIAAISLTHWSMTARVIRAEVMRLRNQEYVCLSKKLGRSRFWIARHHMLPQIVPQFLVSLILMFPHAISHEAALSFIGVGLIPHMPSMGIVLAESLRSLSTGYWWLAVFPGLALLLLVKSFDVLGESVRNVLTPRMRQET